MKENEEDDLRFCFSVVSPNKVVTLQAENEIEKQEWINVIQVCAFSLVVNGILNLCFRV